MTAARRVLVLGDPALAVALKESGHLVTDAAGDDLDVLVNVVDRTAGNAIVAAHAAVREAAARMGAGAAVVNVVDTTPAGPEPSTTAAAMGGLTRAYARELGSRDIRVNLVAVDGAPPEAVAAAVEFLAGPGANGVTGETVIVAPPSGPAVAPTRVVVTGGTRGVGRAAALAWRRTGADVLVVGRTATDDDVLAADLTTAAGRRALAEAVRDRLGGVDVLVNNFASYRPAPLRNLGDDDIAASLSANLTTHVQVTRTLLDALTDGGAVVNLGAGMAERGRPGHTLFTAAKGGLAGFTRSLARELAPRGIRVNTVAPGVVETERGIDLPPPVRAEVLRAIALGRFVTADDVAGAVVFLGGPDAAGITGATLKVDGGV